MSDSCALLDTWLRLALGADDGAATPPDELVAHVHGCARCRGALVLFFAQLAKVPARGGHADCALVEDTLPAFVDYELDHGLGAAAREFPEVWWHTLVCERCDELYRDLRELAALPQLPRGRPGRRPAPSLWPLPRLSIPAGALNRYITAHKSLGAHLGEGQDATMVTEEEADELNIQLCLRPGANWTTQLIVRTIPPISGDVLLSLAHVSYREPLNHEGVAVFPELPDTLFSEHADAALTIAIEQDIA